MLFERVVNAIHKGAPGSAIAFNTRPEDTAEAAARWLKPPVATVVAAEVTDTEPNASLRKAAGHQERIDIVEERNIGTQGREIPE
jgi:hypothetical protein